MKDRLFFTKKYLENRPAFFSLIRPIEADLIYQKKALLKKKVLDFGCGDGFFADLVFGEKEISVGLDVSQSRIHQARNSKVYQKLQEYDGVKIPYSAGYFSGVFSNSVLEHVPDLRGNLKEISRVLKPDGYFLTTVMTKNWDEYLLGKKYFGKRYSAWLKKHQDHENLLTPLAWKKIFEKSGFKVVEEVGYLDEVRCHIFEVWHYLSAPSALFYAWFKKWVLWKPWYKLFAVDSMFENINQQSFTANKQAASIFFVLQKKK